LAQGSRVQSSRVRHIAVLHTVVSINVMSKKLSCIGTTFTVDRSIDKPVLSNFPNSQNCEKALMCFRLSSVWDADCVKGVNLALGENYTLEHARINPNMTLPVLEIDDKIITESKEIYRYLAANYPGPGDAKAPRSEVSAFIELAGGWDEALWSFRRAGKIGPVMFNLREVFMKQNFAKALKNGEESETLLDGRTVEAAYIDKIGWARHFMDSTFGDETPKMTKKIEENDALTEDIMSSASSLLEKSGGPFLFGAELTSADVFLGSIFNRMGAVDAVLVAKFLEDPRLKSWHTHYWESEEFEVVPKDSGLSMKLKMASKMMPLVLGMKCGCYGAPDLPNGIEERINVARAKLNKAYND